MQKIKLADATAAQLYAFATVTMGLEVPADASKNQLLAKLSEAGYAKDTIEVAPEKPARAAAAAAAPKPKMVRVTIHPQDGQESIVKLSVNCSAMIVPRGEEVEIPEHFFEALANAKFEERDQRGLLVREVPRFSYSRHA